MGVFSVIQKQKLHHSNIYSNAPMPFMQRITWSGIAIHAGVLPGYPASHGCIRMPMAFAVKMYGWTKMGARVVVTAGEITPASFSHPLLVEQKVAPQPVTVDEPKAIEKASIEPGPTATRDDGLKPAMGAPSASAPLREQTHTADASSNLPATRAPVTMSDAGSAKADNAPNASTKPGAAKSEAEPAVTKPTEMASSEDKPVETKSPAAAPADIKATETDISDRADKTSDGAAVSTPVSDDAAKAPASETVTTGETKAEANADVAKIDAAVSDVAKPDVSKSDPSKSVEKSDDKAKPAADAAAPNTKDQTRPPDTDKAAASKSNPAMAAAPKRSGQIAVFISRKDAKLYVRQNFAPLFEVPVTIAPGDRPLGTHVFTAEADKNDANVLHWSVVSLPAPSRYTERRDEDERASRRRKMAGVAEMKPMPVPDSPAEALDRLSIPADAMARITEALSTGGSIIVSDQGITAGETGEGTDFIVSLR
jgi:hypothetical protein